MTALNTRPPAHDTPAPVAYRVLNAASHCPSHRDYLLKLAGLFFDQTSETVVEWQSQVFAALVTERCLTRDRWGMYALTRKGEDRLTAYFEQHGPLSLCRV